MRIHEGSGSIALVTNIAWSSSSRRSYFDGSGSGHPFLWLRCHQVIEIDKIDGESKKLSIRIKF